MTNRAVRYSVTLAVAGTAVAMVWMVVARSKAQYDGPTGGTQASSAATPRTAGGHPDLSGLWNFGLPSGVQNVGEEPGGIPKPDEQGSLKELYRNRPCAPNQPECLAGAQFERDAVIRARTSPNRPLYKPEFWDKVRYNDEHENTEDPGFSCYPAGVPRMGPPTKILQTPTEVLFLYQTRNTFRVIPIDGRPHDPIKSQDQTWFGDAVGRWEGDTLVIDIVGFTEETWLSTLGYFHTNNMHVIERLHRQGNTLTWQATVDDPEVLMQPWVMDARTVQLNPDPKATLIEDLPCEEFDKEHMVTREHH